MKCEDYPCCGHTDQDPCEPQWYDKEGAFDTSVNEHAFCDHENGICEEEEDIDDDEDEQVWEAEQDRQQIMHDEMINDKLAQDGRWG